MNGPIKVSDLLFGKGTLDETVNWIREEACRTNTSEAYQRAAWQMQGINRLLMTWQSRHEGLAGTFESIVLCNTIRVLEDLSASTERRAMMARLISEGGERAP